MTNLALPTYDDAQLILRLYELRRDEKLREARDWFRTKFWPQTIEDIRAVIAAKNPHNVHFRMVTTYWEMAASFVTQGVLHPELFIQSGGEMVFVWGKLEPFIAQMREEQKAPFLLENVEKAIARAPSGAERLALVKMRLPGMRQAMQQLEK